ncbi:DNA translocase FtsK [Sphaerisporangium sp. NPDC004334]
MPQEEKLGGRYRLDAILGAGAGGEVWKGFDLRLERAVAVKLMRDQVTHTPRKVQRFVAEAKIVAALSHPNIVDVFDAGEHEGRLFFVMELLGGEDLARVMRRFLGGLPVERVLTILAEVAEGLAAAHAAGVVHRDVKPANIILDGDSTKICDFGVARMVQSFGGRGTSGIGTPAYMAPEQFEGRLEERADVYSLGIAVYELLTGRLPFEGNPQQLMYKHLHSAPTRPRVIRPQIPFWLEELVLAMIAKKPGDRPYAQEIAQRVDARRRGSQRERTRDPSRTSAGESEASFPGRSPRGYVLPSLQILRSGTPGRRRTEADEIGMKAIGELLMSARLDATVSGYNRGPSFTRYEIRLGPTTRPDEVTAIAHLIAAAVGAGDVRLLPGLNSSSPLPGVQAVGVEVPHVEADLVSLGDIHRELRAPDARHGLMLGLGREVGGDAVGLDVVRSPHLLIGGDPGLLITDPLRTIITSAVVQATPDELRMLLLGSVSGRLEAFVDLPHLIEPLVVTPRGQVEALRWLTEELDRRYDDLATAGCRTTRQYNREVGAGRVPAPLTSLGDRHTPHPDVLVVVEELGLSMSEAPEVVESFVVQLTRLGRAVGIHVVLRAHKPDRRTITNRIKAYVPARLGCSMATPEMSTHVVEQTGAEYLGVGNALFRPTGSEAPRALQLARLTRQEVEAITEHWHREA